MFSRLFICLFILSGFIISGNDLQELVYLIESNDTSGLFSKFNIEYLTKSQIPFMECYDSFTPFMIASYYGSLDVCTGLVDFGADPEEESRDNHWNAVQIAFIYNHNRLLNFFTGLGFDISYHLESLLDMEYMRRVPKHFLLAKLSKTVNVSDAKARDIFRYALGTKDLSLVQIASSIFTQISRKTAEDLITIHRFIMWVHSNKLDRNDKVLNEVASSLFAAFSHLFRQEKSSKQLLVIPMAKKMTEILVLLISNGVPIPEYLYEDDNDEEATSSRNASYSSRLTNDDVMRLQIARQLFLARCNMLEFYKGSLDQGSPLFGIPKDFFMTVGLPLLDLAFQLPVQSTSL